MDSTGGLKNARSVKFEVFYFGAKLFWSVERFPAKSREHVFDNSMWEDRFERLTENYRQRCINGNQATVKCPIV